MRPEPLDSALPRMIKTVPHAGPVDPDRDLDVMETLHTLARYEGPRGEVVLRRRRGGDPGARTGVIGAPWGVQGGSSPLARGTEVEELIVNGVFAMDSAETFTEQQLAEVALAGRRRSRVLVGGLGLGYTAAALLAGVDRLDVVEIEECLVEWAYAGLTPTLAAVAADPRVRLHTADVAAVLAGGGGPRGPWDAIVLDVDNGPDFLIHDANAALYAGPGLATAYARLAAGGTLAIWCQGPAPDLLAALRRISGTAAGHTYRRVRQGRELAYAIYTVTRAGPEAQE